MNKLHRASVVAGASSLWIAMVVGNAAAFRLIQNTFVGRVTSGSAVACTDPGGFAHWANSNIAWSYNPASQGGKPGTAAALQSAMASWTNVPSANNVLSLTGTTTAGFATDGQNTIHWGTGEGCSGGCLALTALVLVAGQVIVEADVTMNDAFTWNTNGSDIDVQSVATHELGHTLGIHHTDKNGGVRRRPTMYASYFGIEARSLESDDMMAIQCSQSRYPPLATWGAPAPALAGSLEPLASGSDRVALSSRPRPGGGALIRFRLTTGGATRVELYDVAGREIETLIDGDRAAGEYELAWDGSSSSGPARSGIYFARITTPAGFARASVILTR